MNTRSLLLTTLAGAALLISQSAAAVLIDDFVTAHDVTAGNTFPSPNTSSSAATTAIGGFRDLTVTKTAGAGSQTVTADVNPLGSDRLYVTLGNARGTAEVRWDGPSTSLNVGGLGGVDITGGLINPYFELSLASSDHVGPIRLTVYQNGVAGNFASATLTTPTSLTTSDPAVLLTEAFSNFILTGSASLMDIFTDVGAIVMLIDAQAAAQEGWDLSINYLATSGTRPVSLPGGLALLALGLGLMRRRIA